MEKNIEKAPGTAYLKSRILNLEISKVRIIKISVAAFVLAIAAVSCAEKLSTPELLTKASDAAAKGNWEVAKEFAQRAVKQNPQDADAQVMLAMALEATGDVDKAIDEVRKAVKIDEKNFSAQFTLGRLYYGKADYSQCIGPLKKAYAIKPDSADALILLGKASASLKLSEADWYFAMLAKNDKYKSRPEPWNELGTIYFDRNEVQRAIRYFDRAYALAQDNPVTALNLAVAYDAAGQKANAKKFYYKYLALTVNNSAAQETRAQVVERNNRLSGK